jgi:hypothetical protein
MVAFLRPGSSPRADVAGLTFRKQDNRVDTTLADSQREENSHSSSGCDESGAGGACGERLQSEPWLSPSRSLDGESGRSSVGMWIESWGNCASSAVQLVTKNYHRI